MAKSPVKAKVQDMTVGSPVSNLVKFSIPLLVGNVAQQLYSTVDSIVVGQYVGDNALAAVGAAGPIVMLLFVLFVGISTGAGIMVSQYFGARQQEQLNKTMGNCITLTFVGGLIMMAFGLLMTRPLLSLLRTPEEIYEMAASYLIISFIGVIGSAFYNIISGVLRGLGDSIYTLIFLLVATFLNIILDLVFVAVLGWGVAGVAWATIISQFISGVLCLVRLFSMKNVVHIRPKDLLMHKFYALQIGKLGLPSGITQVIFSMAMILVQSLTNSMGTTLIAANTVVMRVDGFAMMPNFTFGTAMTTFAGQNIGAGLMDRVERGTRDGMKLAVGVSVVLVMGILLFGENLMRLFTTTEDVIELGKTILSVLAVGYVAMAVTQVLSGTMRGAGDTITPMWISLITTVAIRVPVAYVWAWLTKSPDFPNGHYSAIFGSLLTTWVLGALIHIYFYRKGAWRNKAVTNSRD